METESESIDISSIKFALQQPLEPAEFDPKTRSHRDHIEAVKGELQQALASRPISQSFNRDHLPITNNPSNNLESTVSDSQDRPNVDAFLQFMLVQRPDADEHGKMQSQDSAAQATQQISQSFFDDILNRSKLTKANAEENGNDAEETQYTLQEGDHGHVDITSDFAGHAEEQNADSPDISPSQSQSRLTQFPESQRFKTPATAGKKRYYDGQVVDSPELPRKPVLRDGEPTPAVTIGLSQAFAATQAGSSPFIPNIIPNQLSDRPSPDINLQARPTRTSNSSPLMPILDFPRPKTEPASKYVSLKQSQANRNRDTHAKFLNESNELHNGSDDGFGEESSQSRRRRREIQREMRIREEFRQFTSPSRSNNRNKISLSSPAQLHPISSPHADLGLDSTDEHDSSSLSNAEASSEILPESEEETEQEDLIEVNVKRSSQVPSLDEEDKENCDQQLLEIPETTIRLQKIMTGFPADVQASPSLRHSREFEQVDNTHGMQSSEPFAVADSQPPQLGDNSCYKHDTNNPLEVDNNAELTDSSPNLACRKETTPGISEKEFCKKGDTSEIDRYTPHSANNDIQDLEAKDMSSTEYRETKHFQTLTIVEQNPGKNTTMFNPNIRRNVQLQSELPLVNASITSTQSRTNFETAPTSLLATDLTEPSSSTMLSSPPIVTTPPGRKRKRMADIAAEPSPIRQTTSFDGLRALEIDVEFQEAICRPHNSMQSSAMIRPELHQDESTIAETAQQREEVSSYPKGQKHFAENQDLNPTTGKCVSSPLSSEVFVSNPPQTESSPSRLRGGNSCDARKSIWDIEASPTTVNDVKKLQLGANRKPSRKKSASQGSKAVIDESIDIVNPDPASRKQTQDGGQLALNTNPLTRVSHISQDEDIIAPYMVFACFSGKTRAYYPAVCLGPIDQGECRYKIQWEGYEPDEVDTYGIRSLDLRVGDQVKISLPGFPKISYIVCAFKDKIDKIDKIDSKLSVTDVRGFQTLLVAPKQRKSLPAGASTEAVREIPISSIYLDNNMWAQLKDREFKYCLSEKPENGPRFATPAGQQSTPSTPSSRSRRLAVGKNDSSLIPSQQRLFSNMAFAISYDSTLRKTAITDLIQDNGGLILNESFLELLEPDKIELHAQYSALGFTALLTDRHSRKEKYMQALALGLPCLNGRWIEACIKNGDLVDWQTYLLPAGESQELEGATRSRILRNFDPKTIPLSTILSSRPQYLQGTRPLVVTGRGKVELKRKPYLFLIQALGATEIEVVPDLQAAKEALRGKDLFDWLFVDDKDVKYAEDLLAPYQKRRRHCRAVGNELIVQSLILGSLYQE